MARTQSIPPLEVKPFQTRKFVVYAFNPTLRVWESWRSFGTYDGALNSCASFSGPVRIVQVLTSTEVIGMTPVN